MLYPLQTCNSICGVVVMVMSAIACLKPGYFQYLTTTNRQGGEQFPNVFLQRPTQFSKYLRLVVASWITENSVKISYVTPPCFEESQPMNNGKTSVDKYSFVNDDKVSVQPETTEVEIKTKVGNPSNKDFLSEISPKVLPKGKASAIHHSPKSKKKKRIPCSVCSSSFSGTFSLKRHMQSQHPGKLVEEIKVSGKCECNSCDFKCHKIGDLRKHLYENHNVMLKYESVTLNNMIGK